MYVACNIYVSAGRPARSAVLLDVLSKAQARCRVLSAAQREKVALVHAFADPPYDRSSFHLAGSSDLVTDVASQIATQALVELSTSDASTAGTSSITGSSGDGGDGGKSRHPFIGIVDHVSVMPLRSLGVNNEKEHNAFSGQAAQSIGRAMSKAGATVRYYGYAESNNTPLAKVRREQTEFFKSGGQSLKKSELESQIPKYGMATVGAPPNFVENFNIRLSSRCSKEVAKTLTKTLRERDGGIVGVEALTLPYSRDRFEVACNLLQPSTGTAKMIYDAALEWARMNGGESIIEEAYQVGTTEQQCLEVLSRQADDFDRHERQVYQKFASFLSIDSSVK